MNSASPKKNGLFKSLGETLSFLFVAEKDPAHVYWILGVITLCALVLRTYSINRPIGYDEAYTFIHFAAKSFKYILADYHAPNNHILNSILIGISYRLLGSHTWIVRLPAFIASTLTVPAVFFTARRFFSRSQSLAASAVLAIYPSLVQSTANGRGYMMIILFTFILANLAGLLIKKQNLTSLAAYAITGALGFYTIPIFLYPMAGISLWVAVTHLLGEESWKNRFSRLAAFLGTCLVSGLLTLLLYSPVIIFGTGLDSIISNDIVQSRTWAYFIESLGPRVVKILADWRTDLSLPVQYLLVTGFLISILFYRKSSNQKLPLQVFLFLAAAILLILQRVAPMPRIWMYLELSCVVFSVTGLVWIIEVVFKKLQRINLLNKLFPYAALLFSVSILIGATLNTQSASAIADHTVLPEQYAAQYLAEHLKTGDVLLAPGPLDMLTAYHLKILGISYDVFYQRKHPVEFERAFIILRTRDENGTPQKVIDLYQLSPSLDPSQAELVYEYGDLQVYSVQAGKSSP